MNNLFWGRLPPFLFHPLVLFSCRWHGWVMRWSLVWSLTGPIEFYPIQSFVVGATAWGWPRVCWLCGLWERVFGCLSPIGCVSMLENMNPLGIFPHLQIAQWYLGFLASLVVFSWNEPYVMKWTIYNRICPFFTFN